MSFSIQRIPGQPARVVFPCGKCEEELSALLSDAGTLSHCRACGHVFAVPAESAMTAEKEWAVKHEPTRFGGLMRKLVQTRLPTIVVSVVAILMIAFAVVAYRITRPPSQSAFTTWLTTRFVPAIDTTAGKGSTQLVRTDIRLDAGSELHPRVYVAHIRLAKHPTPIELRFAPPKWNEEWWQLLLAKSDNEDVTTVFTDAVTLANLWSTPPRPTNP